MMHKLIVRSKGGSNFEYNQQISEFDYMDTLLKYLNELDFTDVLQVIILDKKITEHYILPSGE